MAQEPPKPTEPSTLDALATRYTAAWNSGSPEAVAACYAPDGGIVINRGQPWDGRAGVATMAAGFFADVPDLTLACDGVRAAGEHVVYLWTFTGTHAGSGRPLRVTGWFGEVVTAYVGWCRERLPRSLHAVPGVHGARARRRPVG